VKCGATTRLSSRVSDRPTKLSQILEMGELHGKLAVLARGESARTMLSSTLLALGADCDRRPKGVALEATQCDNARRDTPVLLFHGLSM